MSKNVSTRRDADDAKSPGRSSYDLFILVAVTIVGTWVLWFTSWPLGVPGEWAWARIPASAEHAFGWIISGLVSAPFLFFFCMGANRIIEAKPFELGIWLAGAVTISAVWLWYAEAANPTPLGHARDPLVVYYPRMSGYFFEATKSEKSTSEFLGGYIDKMKEGEYLHIGTHPPGLILLFRGLHAIGSNQTLQACLLNLETDAIRISFDELLVPGEGLSGQDRAAIHLGILLTNFLAVLTIVPLFFLTALFFGRLAAWRTIAFWPLVPSIVVFLPKSDVMFPVISVGLFLFWVLSLSTRRTSMSVVWGILAGAFYFVGMMLSLAFVPVAVMAAAWGVLRLFDSDSESRGQELRQLGIATASVAAGFLILVGAFSIVGKTNLVHVWYLNYVNHGRFYEFNSRSYLAWLGVNPFELAFALGLPITTLIVLGVIKHDVRKSIANNPLMPVVAVWGLLWLTGKNMGEAARLWIFLLPFFVLGSAGYWSETSACHDTDSVDQSSHSQQFIWVAALCLQLTVCLATGTRIDGFNLGEFLSGPN